MLVRISTANVKRSFPFRFQEMFRKIARYFPPWFTYTNISYIRSKGKLHATYKSIGNLECLKDICIAREDFMEKSETLYKIMMPYTCSLMQSRLEILLLNPI